VEKPFTDTSGKLARDAGVTVATVDLYSDLGLLQFIRISNGTRVFREGQAERVRQICAERMAHRGRGLRHHRGPAAA
jgi:DNA-binding transcriptional MerR regulator